MGEIEPRHLLPDPSSVWIVALESLQEFLHLLAVLRVSALGYEAKTEEVAGQGSILRRGGHRCVSSYVVVMPNKPSAPMESVAMATIQLTTASRNRNVL